MGGYRLNPMARPRLCRRIKFDPKVTYFKPQGVPMRFLEELDLDPDELEAIRLHDLGDCNQIKCAQKMKISSSTFQRILSSAHKKIAEALIKGKAIRISKK